MVANKAVSRSLVSRPSSRIRSPDRAANEAASRSNAPLRRKEPPVSAGGFYLLDRSRCDGSTLGRRKPAARSSDGTSFACRKRGIGVVAVLNFHDPGETGRVIRLLGSKSLERVFGHWSPP